MRRRRSLIHRWHYENAESIVAAGHQRAEAGTRLA